MFDRNVFTKDFITLASIPSNVSYGSVIFERNAVEILSDDEDILQAWVGGLSGAAKEGGGFRRKVTFQLEDGVLGTHCMCNPKKHQIFCKHCVALALKIMEENIKK